MFTAGGQPDLHVVMRGGGGKGGGAVASNRLLLDHSRMWTQ